MNQKKKLLWISRFGYPCSYSYVSEGLLPFLCSHYDMSIFCTGIVHTEDSRQRIANQLKLFPEKVFIIDKILNNSNLIEDHEYFSNYFFGIYHLEHIINQVKPDVIVSIDDQMAIQRQLDLVQTTSWNFRFEFIPYMPVDMIHISNIFKSYPPKRILTMSNFGKEEILKLSPEINVSVLPPIVDPTIFYPLVNKKQLQHKWLNTDNNFLDKRSETAAPEGLPKQSIFSQEKINFIIGAFNANNTRKRWDILIDSFGKFSQQHDNVILLIKTNNTKPQQEFGLVSCGEYNFEQLILETCQKYQLDSSKIRVFNNVYTNVELNELYNCCDLGLSTTSGEGWGLISCEMALCKIPQLVPAWSSFPEIFSESQGLMPIKEYTSYVGREYRHFPETLKNRFIPIIKTYIYHEFVTLKVNSINLTEGIPTICISPHGSNPEYALNVNVELLSHFSKVTEAIEFIQKYKLPDRLQILLGLDTDFLIQEAPNLGKLYEILPKTHRINYLLSLEELRKYWDLSSHSVGLVSVDTVVNTLEKFYTSPELRNLEGEYQYQKIHKICNPDIINKQLHKYITDTIYSK